MARRRMSPEQAQRLAEKYQERYPNASPREIAEIVNDPTMHFYEPILEGMYRGLKIPENMTTPQADAWKAAVDQRMAGFEDRQTALQADARRRLNEEIRRDIAGVVKPASMAASLTPYDLGLGDVGYAAGELIDPGGTYEDAMLAAGGGLLTGGLGSGALMAKGAKGIRKAGSRVVAENPGAVAKAPMPRGPVGTFPDKPTVTGGRRIADATDAVLRNPGAVSKYPIGAGVKRADDVEDLTPTVMYDNPLNFPKGVRGSRTRGSTGGSEYQSRAARDAKAYADSMRTPPQIDPKVFNREMRKRSKQSPYVVDRVIDAAVPAAIVGYGGASAIGALGGFEGQENVSAGAGGMKTGPGTLHGYLSEYYNVHGKLPFNAPDGMGPDEYMEEMQARKEEYDAMWKRRFDERANELAAKPFDRDREFIAAKPIDPNLSVRMMNEVRKTTDYGNAFAETTDRQSPMNFSSADALSDLPGFYQENRENAARIFEQTGTVPPGMARSLGKYEALMNTRGALLNEEDRMLREGISFKPSTPIVEDRTAMAGQGGMDREIEPAMGDYGE